MYSLHHIYLMLPCCFQLAPRFRTRPSQPLPPPPPSDYLQPHKSTGSSQLRRGDSLPILPSPSEGVAPDEALTSSSSHAGGGPPVTPPSLYHPGQRQNFYKASGIPHSAPGRVSIVPNDSLAQHPPFVSAPLFMASVEHVGGRLTLPDSVAGLASPSGGPVEFSRLDAGAYGKYDDNDDGGGGMPPRKGLFHRVEVGDVRFCGFCLGFRRRLSRCQEGIVSWLLLS